MSAGNVLTVAADLLDNRKSIVTDLLLLTDGGTR